MDRGAWRATVQGIARVRHDLALSFFREFELIRRVLKERPWIDINKSFSFNISSLIWVFSSGVSVLWASLVAQMVKNLPTMQETQVQSLGQEDFLEKEMASHSSTLDLKVPWTEVPGRLQSMGSQRVGND